MIAIDRLLGRLRRRIQLLVQRARVNAINSGAELQLVQIKVGRDEVLHDVDHVEPYGFTSRAQVGSEAVLASLGGSRTHAVVLLVGDRRYRLTGLAAGEVALHDDQDQEIILRRDKIEINAPFGYVITGDGVLDGTVQITGAVQMDSTLNVDDDATGPDFISSGKSGATHTHSGVQPGVGTSGSPV